MSDHVRTTQHAISHPRKIFEPILKTTRLSRLMTRGSFKTGSMLVDLQLSSTLVLSALVLMTSVTFSACTEGAVLFNPDADLNGTRDEQDTTDAVLIGDDNPDGCEGGDEYVPIATGTNTPLCSGQLAEQTFRFALCSCSDVSILGGLYTGSFDSAEASLEDEDNVGGAVGVNSELLVLGNVAIGGTAIQTGADGVTLYGATAVRGDLKVAGNLSFERSLSVDRDAVVGGDLVAMADATIGRDLYLGGEMTNGERVSPSGALVTGAVDVAAPCACGDDEIIDVAAIVDAAETDNRNDIVGLEAGSLEVIDTYVDVTLPCGRYYLTAIGGAGRLTLHIDGPVAVFIGGNFDLFGDLDLDLGENGTLDIFVAGNLELTGLNDFWDITQPSKVRFYVGGDEDLYLTNVSGFNLYAPRAHVVLASATVVLGSVFAGDFLSMDDTIIHYDRDVLREGARCDSGTFGESPCGATGSACAVDADCCAPLVCDRELCHPLGVVI